MKFTLNNDVAIHVTDLKKATEFYRDVLGFEFIEINEEYARLRKGEINFYLNKGNKVIPPIFSFDVEDVNLAKEYLLKSGCKIISDSGKSVYAKDINGLIFDFIEPDETPDK